jgi:hypothetical protein
MVEIQVMEEIQKLAVEMAVVVVQIIIIIMTIL